MPQAPTLLLASVLVLGASLSQAQTGTPVLSGTWQGAMMIGPTSYSIAFTLSPGQEGTSATFTSRDMGVFNMPADSVEVDAVRIRIRVRPVDGEYTGFLRLSDDGSTIVRIDGDWFQQGEMLPVVLRPVE